MAAWEELAKQALAVTPTLIWGGLAFYVAAAFRKPIAEQIPRWSGFKAAGIEISLAERKMEQAADLAVKHNFDTRDSTAATSRRTVGVESTVNKPIEITRTDRDRVLARAERCAGVLKDKRILWIDDNVANNRSERDLLEAFGINIEQVQSNAAALAALESDHAGYSAVISDIARPEGEPTGLDFLREYRQREIRHPVIF